MKSIEHGHCLVLSVLAFQCKDLVDLFLVERFGARLTMVLVTQQGIQYRGLGIWDRRTETCFVQQDDDEDDDEPSTSSLSSTNNDDDNDDDEGAGTISTNPPLMSFRLEVYHCYNRHGQVIDKVMRRPCLLVSTPGSDVGLASQNGNDGTFVLFVGASSARP